jgi:hypothetical protein
MVDVMLMQALMKAVPDKAALSADPFINRCINALFERASGRSMGGLRIEEIKAYGTPISSAWRGCHAQSPAWHPRE